MERSKRLSGIDLSVPKPISDYDIIVFSRLNKLGFIVDMVEEMEPRVIGS
jgi:hypothetical protein